MIGSGIMMIAGISALGTTTVNASPTPVDLVDQVNKVDRVDQVEFHFPSLPRLPGSGSRFPGDDGPLPDNVTVLSPPDLRAWTAPAYYASAAYCPGSFIQDWNCGPACDALHRPLDIAIGGDGETVPRYFVAELSDKTLLVSISGTNASASESIDIDLDFLLVPTDQRDFPGGHEAGILLHKGFYEAFGRMRGEIGGVVLAGVGRGVKDITVVGHSLGGALAQLVGTYLQILLGWDATVKVRGFATPRTGNERWADYVDAVLGDNHQFMVNFADHVPHLPPRLWGYWHSAGEVWSLPDPEIYWLCGGQENPACSLSLETPEHEIELVKSFIDLLGVPEHLGPYAGVTISDMTCPV